MTYQSRLRRLEPNETWPTLHGAAWERYWDGMELATCGQVRHAGAIHLLGYVAEILLKVAFYRIVGYSPGQAADTRTIKIHSDWHGKNMHSLTDLAQVLVAERATRQIPLDPVFGGLLTSHVLTISNHRKEDLRYRYTLATQAEMAEVYQSVDWLLTNATLLWS